MIQPHELETRVLDIIDRVKKAQPIEDSLVEVKADWVTDPQKAARRIGGHANAAHGQPILWIIGLDEKGARVTGASKEDLANWWPQVSAWFDAGVAPDLLRHLAIPCENKTVVALFFDTSRAPYVVKTPGNQTTDREVPWRTATGVGTATRQDLLRLLSPMQKYPQVDLMWASLSFVDPRTVRTLESHSSLRIQMFVAPAGSDPLVLPFHRIVASINHDVLKEPALLNSVQFDEALVQRATGARTNKTSNILLTGNVAQFNGPDVAWITWKVSLAASELVALREQECLPVRLLFRSVSPDIGIRVALSLTCPEEQRKGGRWQMADHRIAFVSPNDT